jgi:hypothetical protein
MKTTIDVQDRREGDLIKQALADPETRAFVNVMGAMQKIPLQRRRRVLAFVADQLEAQDPAKTEPR